MSQSGGSADDPIIHPRVIKRLKERPRLINDGLREQFLQEMENVVTEKRKPQNVAESAVLRGFERFQEAGGGVAKKAVQTSLERGNESIFEQL